MIKVIGVRFRTAGKIYFFDPLEFEIKRGDHVIVETARGVEYGTVVSDPKEVEEASMKNAPVKEPRKGMKKRLIILAIIAWIILSVLCYLLTPPLVLGIVIFTLVYNIFKRLKI